MAATATTDTRTLWDRIRGRESKPESNVLALSDVLQRYDLVEAMPEQGVVVVSERPKRLADKDTPDTRELGNASTSPFTSYLRGEYNSELRGILGLQKYDQMRKSDGTVRGSMRMLKSPILGARWFIEAASESTRDQNAADFAWWNLNEAMSIPFEQVIQECLLMLEFGYYMFEKVWTEGRWNNRDVLYWKKLAPRHPIDVKDWHFDSNGGPRSVEFYAPDSVSDDVKIKIAKMLVFTFDREAGNIEGISVLRSAYKHFFYKDQLYKIDAIQKERHGIGVPVIKLPANFTPGDKALAQAMASNLRTNENAGLVLPPNWEMMFAKLEGQPVNALDSAKHHDLQIQKNIMAPFLDEGIKPDEMSVFKDSARFIAAIITMTFNHYAIPQLIGYNFERVGVPKLRVAGIGSRVDQRTFTFAIRNLVGANVLSPDERLEAFVREELELPAMDPKTKREVATPQAGGARVGLPRQSTADNSTQGKTAGSQRVGEDVSGGK